jgi:hypothetical protein
MGLTPCHLPARSEIACSASDMDGSPRCVRACRSALSRRISPTCPSRMCCRKCGWQCPPLASPYHLLMACLLRTKGHFLPVKVCVPAPSPGGGSGRTERFVSEEALNQHYWPAGGQAADGAG